MYGGLAHGVSVRDCMSVHRGLPNRVAMSHSLSYSVAVAHSHHWHVTHNVTHAISVAQYTVT